MLIVKQFQDLRRDRGFLKRVAVIALPIMLQFLLNNVLNLVDALMIGRLGESTIAAVGLANKIFFVFSLLSFGICSGASILESQYWGVKDVKSIRKAQGLALLLSLSAALAFLVAASVNPEMVMRIFTNSDSAVAAGARYLRIVVWSYPLTAVTQAYITTLRSVNQVKAPVVISTISIFVNVFFNYALIFGHFGLPELGVEGAALATTVARVVECLSLLLLVYWKKGPGAGSPKQMFGLDRTFVKLFFATATPVICNEFIWGLGVTMYSLVFGRMGDSATAAITVTQNIEEVAQVVFMGLSNAAAIILGNELGAGLLKRAEKHAKDFIFMQFIISALIIFLFCFLKGPVIALFHLSDSAAHLTDLCFIVFMCYLPFKVFNLVNICGILRSGGDTKIALLLDCTGVWCIGIPMAFLGGMVLKQPIYIVYAMVLSEEIYKMVIGLIRYRKKKWLRNLVEEPAEQKR